MIGFKAIPRRGVSIVPWLVGAAILTVLALLILPAFRRGPSPQRWCQVNLKNIVVALHSYERRYGVLPPAYTVDGTGRPLHSWRTLILPELDEFALYRTIDLSKPWNDPVNAKALATPIRTYQCRASIDRRSNRTTYMVVTGAGTCFPSGETCSLKDIKDGPADTLLVVEVSADRAVSWMEPVDTGTEMLLDLSKDSSLPHPLGFSVAFADGTVRFQSRELTLEQRRAMTTTAGSDHTGLENP